MTINAANHTKRKYPHAAQNALGCTGSSAFSESQGLELQAGCFLQSEHEIHVLHGLPRSALEEVVDAGGHEELVAMALGMDEAFVGVDDLLEVDGAPGIVDEGGFAIEIAIVGLDFFQCALAAHHHGGEQATGEVGTIGDEVNLAVEVGLELTDGLHDFGDVFMFEGLEDAHIARTPGEMRRGRRLYAGSRATDKGVHCDIASKQTSLSQGQESELDACGSITGIGHMERTSDSRTVQFGQAIDIVIVV